jgi:hypothetical protein
MATATKGATKSKGALKPVTEAKTETVSRKAMPPAWLLENAVIVALLAMKTKLVEVKGSLHIPEGKEWKGIPEGDTRMAPRDGFLSLQNAVIKREKGADGALLKEDSDLFDFDSFPTFQIAVAGCKNAAVLEAVAKKLLGKAPNLDAAAEAGKADRNKPSDLKFLKELVYCAGTLLHLTNVSQHNQAEYFSALDKFQRRLSNLRYNKVTTWDDKGQPAEGARVPRMETAPKSKIETVLGIRVTAKQCAFAKLLRKDGKMNKKVAAEMLGSNCNNVLLRMTEWGSITVKKGDTPELTIITANKDWPEGK